MWLVGYVSNKIAFNIQKMTITALIVKVVVQSKQGKLIFVYEKLI